MLCIAALVISTLGVIPAEKSYAAVFTPVEIDGTCQTGYVDDGAAYYSFELPTNGTARIGVSSGCSSISMTIAKTQSFYSPIYEAVTDTTVNLPAGTYYVEVDCTADHDCTESFEISANFVPLSEYDAEPNNTQDTAITMTSGQSYKGHVYSSFDDVDWYKLVVSDLSVVHWYLDIASGATGYIFAEDGTWVSTIKGSSPGYTYPMYGLAAGTYYIRISPAYGVDRNYTFSARIVERPTINKIKSVTPTAIGSAKITWTESKYAEGYYLAKEYNNSGSYNIIATLPAGTLSYTDTSAPYLGSSCTYHICAYRFDSKDPYNPHQAILSEETNEGYTYTGKVPVPANVKAVKNTGNIKISWNAVSGATGYKVFRKANGGTFKLVKTISSSSTLSWKDTTVKKGTNYTYKVRAYYKDYYGTVYNSNYSSTVSAKLAGTIAAPGNVKVKKYSSYNKVSWNKISTATGYKVYRKVGSGSYKLVKTTTAASYKDTSVKKGKKYTYKVKAYYNNYTYNATKGKYTYKTVNSNYSKTAAVKR